MNILNIIGKVDITNVSEELVTRVAEEECAELIQAISKESRGKANRDNTHEEIADVMICIAWLIEKLNLNTYEINKWIDYKTNRSKERIANNEFK